MIIKLEGTDLGNSTMTSLKIEGDHEKLVSLIVGAMHQNPPFAELMEDAYAVYLIEIGALHEG